METKEHKTIYSRHWQSQEWDVDAGWRGVEKDCRESSSFGVRILEMATRKTDGETH
jgi:hypothetical protein